MGTLDLSLHNNHLDGSSFFWTGSETGILLFHGFTATTTEVRLLADRFKQFGFTISAPLLPGHGSVVTDLEKVHWQDWITCAEESFSEISQKTSKIIIGGESMGSLLALSIAQTHPNIAGILAYSPALRVKGLQFSSLLSRFFRFSPKRHLSDGLAWKGYKYNSLVGAAQVRQLQIKVTDKLKDIKQPICIFVGQKDSTIDISGADTLFNGVSSQKKYIHRYPNSHHCILLDSDLESVAERSISFINSII